MPHRLRKVRERIAARKGSASQEETPLKIELEKELQNDLVVLKRFDSVKKKAAYKAERLPRYIDWVNGRIEADRGEPDRIVTYMLAWTIDTGNIGPFIEIARYMLTHDLDAPFETKLPSFIADNARAHIEELSIEEGLTIATLIKGRDVNDQAHAKFLRALGEKIEAERGDEITLEEKRTVLAIFTKAVEFDANVGVKKRAELLAKEIADLEAAEEGED